MNHTGEALRTDVARDLNGWDDFVRDCPESTFAHQAAWRSILGDVLGHECLYLEARDGAGCMQGVLPLVRVRGPVGHFLVSVPFVNDGGPVGSPVARLALAEHALTIAKTTRAGVLELRSREPIDSERLASSFRKVAVHLRLPETVEALWSQTFKAKLRSQIRRPGKEGMTAHVGHEQLDAFYAVFSRNMRDLGTPVLPRGFFESLVAAFGNAILIACVRTKEGQPVAASFCMTWRDEMEVTWASSLREFNPQSPNMLLYATMMEQAVTRGVRVFNFGRSTPGAATHRFKQQWGGQDVPLPWAAWSRSGANGPPSGDSKAFRLAVAVWQRLPLAVANRVGPRLSRFIP